MSRPLNAVHSQPRLWERTGPLDKRRLILRHKHGLGDTVLLSGLVRDIDRTYPGQFEIVVDSHFREVFADNPRCRPYREGDEAVRRCTQAAISYRQGIRAAGRGQKVHMLAWFHRDFTAKTGLDLQPLEPRGELFLPPHLQAPLLGGQRYWLIVAGGKQDITCKWWLPSRWQQVVDALAARGIAVAQAGARFQGNWHPTLRGVIDVVDRHRDARAFFNLVKHADGVICPVTAAMHIAACFDKPCVALNGGREEPWWEAYVNCYQAFGPACAPVAVEHRFLHTLGQLACCLKKGCWKHRTLRLNDGREWDRPDRICPLPVREGEYRTPKCLEMISPEHVLEAVMSYYERGEIPPIGTPRKIDPVRESLLAAEDQRFIAECNRVLTTPGETAAPPVPRNPAAAAAIQAAGRQIAEQGVRPAPVLIPGLVKTSFVKEDGPALTAVPRSEILVREYVHGPDRPPRPAGIDHPLIGGKFTVCVLCYGPHADLARRCIGSILTSLPHECLDLRVGCNAVEQATMDYLRSLPVPVTLYDHPDNIKKYPLMREMFHGDRPITSRYLVWFDDDAKVVDPSMWSKLCAAIIANHPHGCRLYGNLFTHDLARNTQNAVGRAPRDPLAWFRQARWWRKRDLRIRGRDATAPNGTVIAFAAGWFWALDVAAMRAAGIPDERLNHNGGDITLGEQVHQAGFHAKLFNKDKALVWCPPKENGGRRGYSEDFPWRR